MLASKLTPKVFNFFTGAPQKLLSPAIHYKNVNSSVSPVKWSSFEFSRKYHPRGQDSNLPQEQKSAAQSSLKDNTTKENPKTVKAFLMTPKERQRFLDEFPKILSDLTNLDGYELMTETKQWANRVVEYNVPHGKHYRSALLIKMAQEINLNSQNGLELPNLYKIGWTFELLQAFLVMVDDMMDGSTTRRNEPCWYLKDDLGMAAINDGLLCESMAYALLKKYAKGKYPMYEEILDLYHDVILRCIHGQGIDLLVSRNKQYSKFTEDTWNKMVTFKNGFYTFYWPTAGALLLNGINDKMIFKSLESLSADMAIFFTMQDDYLDCYADPKVSGKIGTDIQDGKCSWLMVNALKKANSHQRKALLDNYGQNCPEKVARVKALYNEMGIPEMYSHAQDKAFKNLDESIASLHPVIPKGPLESIVDVMFKRSSSVEAQSMIIEKTQLLSKEERQDFNALFPHLIQELVDSPELRDMPDTNRWLAKVLKYNVPHGKQSRGLSTVLACKYFVKDLSQESMQPCYVLGWCVEMLQAHFLVSDDIMDGSETRRGAPCWYRVDDLGTAAFNDAILLEASIYSFLKKYFGDTEYYARLMEIFHDATFKTTYGQSLDTRTGIAQRFETYTLDLYSAIVKYKANYYTFYLPVVLGMTVAGIKDAECLRQVEAVSLEMGHFFQVQDDYLDCFGDVGVTGKIGTDIQDGKCSWLVVNALQNANSAQRRILLENYGKNDPEKVEAVKELFRDMGIEKLYLDFEQESYNKIKAFIEEMSPDLPKKLFHDMLNKIYKRSS